MLARSFDTAEAVVVVGGGCGLVVLQQLQQLGGFLGRRIGLMFDRFRSSVVVRKRGCQTRSHGSGSGSRVEEEKKKQTKKK